MVRFGLKPAMRLALEGHDNPVDQFKKIVTITRIAREAGFHSLWIGQHYFTGNRTQWEVIPMLARLIPEAHGMRVGTCVLLLPLHSPILMAEQVSVLDILSEGRFIFGVGLGYRESEFSGFGISKGERASRFEEALVIIRKLWTEDHVRFEGKHFTVNDLTTGTRPVQTPTPPIWIAAHGDRAVKRAARLGDSLIMNPHASLETLERQLSVYRVALEEAGKPFPEELAGRKDIYVAQERNMAWAEAEREIPGIVRSLRGSGQHKELPESDRFDLSGGLGQFLKSRFIVGGPEDCIEQIENYRAKIGINHFIFRVACPGGGLREVIGKIELIGREIINHFEKVN